MSAGILVRGWFAQGATMARALPFAVFIALMAAEPWLGRQVLGWMDPHWLYGLRSLIVGGLLLLFWRRFHELNAVRRPVARDFWAALGVGLLVLLIWLTLDFGVFVLGQSGSGFEPHDEQGSIDWSLALMRLVGSALLVPLMEELFWRSLVMRWLDDADFLSIDPAQISWRALLVSSVVFGFEHSQWVAGILAGLAYGWLYMRTGNLWVAVFAHAVTNAGLGVWVLVTGAWYFW